MEAGKSFDPYEAIGIITPGTLVRYCLPRKFRYSRAL